MGLSYIPTILTIVFGIYITLKNQQKAYDTSTLLGWIITLIGLLATSLLIERVITIRKIEKSVNETNNFLKLRDGLPSLDSILKNRQQLLPLEERLKYSKDIRITGGSLFRLSSEYIGFFEEKVKEGCRFKFLLLNPDCSAAKLIAENIVYEVDSYEVYKNNINNAIANLKALKTKFPEKIHIKITDFIPSYSLFICDPDNDQGNIMVELYTPAVTTRQRPHLILLKGREPGWFKFFCGQFESIWNNSSNIEITVGA
jgi:hypothetical protein